MDNLSLVKVFTTHSGLGTQAKKFKVLFDIFGLRTQFELRLVNLLTQRKNISDPFPYLELCQHVCQMSQGQLSGVAPPLPGSPHPQQQVPALQDGLH